MSDLTSVTTVVEVEVPFSALSIGGRVSGSLLHGQKGSLGACCYHLLSKMSV